MLPERVSAMNAVVDRNNVKVIGQGEKNDCFWTCKKIELSSYKGYCKKEW